MIVDSIESEQEKALRRKQGFPDLLKKLGAVSAFAAVIFVLGFVPSLSAQDEVSLTILHTNDLHGIMLPFEEEGEMVGG
ncbi:MAG: hypothetical protein KAW49_03150, partial [Anaerolineae bacterium]|nr:hypothetical protein [Anaerolineae bacterium]